MALTGKFTDIPSGNLKPSLNGNKLGAAFNMKAQFTVDGNDCGKGEYRQYVEGQFKVNDSVLAHRLCDSTWLEVGTLHEDGCGPHGSNPGPCTAYGHRACPDHPYDVYSPDPRSKGCTYAGWDEPGVSGQPGDKLEVDLSFLANLVNVETGEVLATASWTVKGTATVPTKTLHSTTTTQLAAAQHVDAKLEHYKEEGHWKLTLLIARPAQALALDTGDIQVSLLSSERQPLVMRAGHQGSPYVAGGSKAVTETRYYYFEDSGPVPSALQIEYGGNAITLDLKEE